ncbi:MAG: tRNA adenosine(34) deaminase TadA [Actinomycetales bacterium]
MTDRPADLLAMQQALALAERAGEQGELPIGAVVIDDRGRVVGAAGNARESSHDPTAHAEILALRQAGAQVGNWRLHDHTLVVTLEPCPMCAGAAVQARVARVVFGAWNPEYGAAGSHWDLLRDRRLSHRPEVVQGVLAEECGTLVREFLAQRR